MFAHGKYVDDRKHIFTVIEDEFQYNTVLLWLDGEEPMGIHKIDAAFGSIYINIAQDLTFAVKIMIQFPDVLRFVDKQIFGFGLNA